MRTVLEIPRRSIMRSFVGLILAVSLVEIASGVSPEYLAQAVAAKDKCAKEHNIDDSVVQAFIKKKKMPETEPEKCMLACYMEEMKMLVDGKPNAEVAKATNKEKWDDAAIVSKADKVVDTCVAEVSPDGKNKCDFAVELTVCLLKHGKEEGIPAPDFEKPKRR